MLTLFSLCELLMTVNAANSSSNLLTYVYHLAMVAQYAHNIALLTLDSFSAKNKFQFFFKAQHAKNEYK